MSWQIALSAVEIAWLVGASCWILLEKRSPTATLAWVFGMALLPLVGFFVYFFLGPRRLERKRLKRLRAIAAVRERAGDLMPSIAAPDRKRIAQLMRLAAQADGLPAGTAH